MWLSECCFELNNNYLGRRAEIGKPHVSDETLSKDNRRACLSLRGTIGSNDIFVNNIFVSYYYAKKPHMPTLILRRVGAGWQTWRTRGTMSKKGGTQKTYGKVTCTAIKRRHVLPCHPVDPPKDNNMYFSLKFGNPEKSGKSPPLYLHCTEDADNIPEDSR